MSSAVEAFMEDVIARNPHQKEFHRAVQEMVESILSVLDRHPAVRKANILERIVEPERVILFRVPWQDDAGEVHVHRGMRVEFNSAIGPYHGGLRFHPSVNLGTLKFLGFEQIFKNALTTLPMGGGAGGADFNPKGRSDSEVMRFCQSFMNELHRCIGESIDVPTADIGVGRREVGYLFGQYKRLTRRFESALTGEGLDGGGSLTRPEAVGYGQVYFAEEMLKTRGKTMKGMRCVLSGAGRAAQSACEKVLDLGGTPLTFSDSTGFIVDEDGIDREKLAFVKHLKNVRRGRIQEYKDKYPKAHYEPIDPRKKSNPLWNVKCDVALPSATQDEIDEIDAQHLVHGGCLCVSEGANMPTTRAGARVFLESKILYGPGKAAGAGGAVISGLERIPNAIPLRDATVGEQLRLNGSREEIDNALHQIMIRIHKTCLETADAYGTPGHYVNGANIAAFLKVANAMMEQGLV